VAHLRHEGSTRVTAAAGLTVFSVAADGLLRGLIPTPATWFADEFCRRMTERGSSGPTDLCMHNVEHVRWRVSGGAELTQKRNR
jgi:hypothetical protein